MNSFARAIVIAAASLVAVTVDQAARARIRAIRAQPAAAGQSASPDTAERGKAVYETRCVECHGASGRGDGPAAPHLVPAPRDFTSAKYKIRSTETGSLPTDEDLMRSVRQGLYGSAMPAWDGLLSDGEIGDVVEYVKGFSPRFRTEEPRVVSPGAQTTSSPDSVARGQRVYGTLQCGKCHGTDGRGKNAVATVFVDDWNRPLRATDLTEPWHFHGGSTSRDIYLRFRTGMSGTPMPAFGEAASDGDMWDLAHYVVSIARKPVWSMSAEEAVALYARQDLEAKANPVVRGRYLVDTLRCTICHSPMDGNKQMIPGMRLAGGLLLRVEPFGDYPTGNLTSDKDTGLGNWTDEEIIGAITRGTLRDGTRLPPYPMDYASYSTMTPQDLQAIVAYLRTVPPVSNKVPRPARTFLPVYLWGKFKMLILGDDPPFVFLSGNAARGGRR